MAGKRGASVGPRSISGAAWALGIVASLVLTACMAMQQQPSFQRQESPRLSAPPGSVPVGGRPKVYTEAEALGLSNPLAGDVAAAAAGKALYEVNCSMCHGADGQGTGAIASYYPPQPSDLTGEAVRGRRDGHLFWAISNGFGRMPAFQNRLSEEERWRIVSYLRQLQGN